MSSLPSLRRKSSETFNPPHANPLASPSIPGMEELDELIASGQGDQPRMPVQTARELSFQARAAKMRERMALLPSNVLRPELARPIQLSLPGPGRKLPPVIRAALGIALEVVGFDIGLSVREFMTPGKGRRELFQVRQLVAVQLRAKKLSFPTIGRMMGGVHHTSVLYMVRTCPERERRMVLAEVEQAEERQKQNEKFLSEPVDYTAWDEWI